MTAFKGTDNMAMARAYANNKDVLNRSYVGTPYIQVLDRTWTLGESIVRVSYCLQDNAGVELWQPAPENAEQQVSWIQDFASEFLRQLQQIVADIRRQAPRVLHVEFELSPCSWPPQDQLRKILQDNGYKDSGHDSWIVAGDVSHMVESLGKTLMMFGDNQQRLNVVRLSTKQHGRDFGTVFNEAYQMPSVWGQQSAECFMIQAERDSESQQYLRFVGYLDEEPVVCAFLCMAAGVVGIHYAGTRPAHQKQGLFQELVYTVLKDHVTASEYATTYVASARPTSAPFFLKHGAHVAATKYKYYL